MRTVGGASNVAELKHLSRLLAGCEADVGAIELTGDELQLPFAFADPSQARSHADIGLFHVGATPLLRAYLQVRHASDYELVGEPASGSSSLRGLEFDPSTRELVVSFDPGVALRVSVTELEVRALASDDEVGERRLSMYL